MNIPNLPLNSPLTDSNGMVHSHWNNFLTQLIGELQKNASNEGLKVPQQSAANLGILNNDKSLGALIYDSENHVLKININGTFKTVLTA